MIKLLVVEDEVTLADNIKEILADIGEITLAYDGEEGLFEAESGVYDLILLDLMLPGKNGYEVLAALREQNIQTPVLILTAKDGLEDKVTGFQKGADDYLTKPFYREELIQGKEFELLLYFIQNKGVIITKEQIFDRIWGFDSETTITVVEVYMSHLRKHLKPSGMDQRFKTLRNVGYILQDEE